MHLRVPWLAIAVLIAPPAVAKEAPVSLQGCYEAALHRAESVAIDDELIRQAEEQYQQAYGSMLPSVNASYGLTKQKEVKNGLGQSISPTYQPLAKITASQPLFVGFKDLAVKRQVSSLITATKLDRDGAMLQLYKDTATTFYTIAAAEQDLADVHKELELYAQRIKDLEHFRRIGRSQASDVLTAQTSEATLQAVVKQLEGQIAAARQVLSVVTGLSPDVPLLVEDMKAGPGDSLATYLQRIDARPEIAAATVRSKAAGEGIAVARAGHLPSVSLNGNYYLQRTGVQKDVTWDVTLAATMPIYSGGIVTSQVAQAQSVQRQSETLVAQLRRSAEQDIRSLHATVGADQEQLRALKFATDLGQKNYQAQVQNFRLGLVTNLDVLTALTSFQENQRAYDRQRFTLLLNSEKLQVAAVKRPAGFALSSPPEPVERR